MALARALYADAQFVLLDDIFAACDAHTCNSLWEGAIRSLVAAHKTVVAARGKALVKTDLAIVCPEGTYGRIAPRSGLAWKKHVDVGAGVIDADYRGPVGVVLFNHADEELVVEVGDRVAQLVLERIVIPEVLEVDELDETERGAGGFGSTGTESAD